MGTSFFDKMEEAAGISIPSAGAAERGPYKKGERVKHGGEAKEWSGPKPWHDKTKATTPSRGDGSASPL